MNHEIEKLLAKIKFNLIALDQIVASAIPADDFEKIDAEKIIESSISQIDSI